MSGKDVGAYGRKKVFDYVPEKVELISTYSRLFTGFRSLKVTCRGQMVLARKLLIAAGQFS